MEKTYQERKQEKFEEFKLLIGEMSEVEIYSLLYDIGNQMRPDELEELIVFIKYPTK